MTENEAIRDLEYLIEEYSAYPPETGVNETIGSLQYCITALKEIRLYKDNKLCLVPEDVYSRQCSELDAYKEIGTVEECREAVEKQKPKKPKDSLKINPVIDGNGAYVDADMTVYLLCPNCGEMIGIDESCDKFCRECGQAIDENLEGMEDE